MTQRTVSANDRARGHGAAYHLGRCLLLARLVEVKAAQGNLVGARTTLTMAGSHMRTARGYLGAVGFEGGWRL